jgi:hypothetical protein
MAIRSKTEEAFRDVLQDSGVTIPIHISQANQTVAKVGLQRVNIRAISGEQTRPKTRVIRMIVLVSVETNADKDDADVEDPEARHKEGIDTVQSALDDNVTPLAQRLSAARDEVGPFTCLFVQPIGDVSDVPQPGDRIFRDTIGYTVIVAEGNAT